MQRPTDRQATHSAHAAAHHRRRLQSGCWQKHGYLVCRSRKSIPVLLGSRHVAALKQSSRCSLADQTALHTVSVSVKLPSQHLSQHVLSSMFHGLICRWQAASGNKSHTAFGSLRKFTPHAAASAYMLTEEVQTHVSLACRL